MECCTGDSSELASPFSTLQFDNDAILDRTQPAPMNEVVAVDGDNSKRSLQRPSIHSGPQTMGGAGQIIASHISAKMTLTLSSFPAAFQFFTPVHHGMAATFPNVILPDVVPSVGMNGTAAIPLYYTPPECTPDALNDKPLKKLSVELLTTYEEINHRYHAAKEKAAQVRITQRAQRQDNGRADKKRHKGQEEKDNKEHDSSKSEQASVKEVSVKKASVKETTEVSNYLEMLVH